jgi:hypothetical protein
VVPPKLPGSYSRLIVLSTQIQAAQYRDNGRNPLPAKGQSSRSPAMSPQEGLIGEFSRSCSAGTSPGSHLSLPVRWQMAYYSYLDSSNAI